MSAPPRVMDGVVTQPVGDGYIATHPQLADLGVNVRGHGPTVVQAISQFHLAWDIAWAELADPLAVELDEDAQARRRVMVEAWEP